MNQIQFKAPSWAKPRRHRVFLFSLAALLVGWPVSGNAEGKLNQLSYSQSCERILEHLSKKSFQTVFEDLTEKDNALKQLSDIYSHRSPFEQRDIDEKESIRHLDREMSFQVKNPRTGNYDKFVAVPANARIAPMKQADFQRLVRSTGPVMRALRKLLQNIYSHKELNAENLGLRDLPEMDRQLVVNVVKHSIYLEPFLQAPQMKDYPFLSVGGFDGAIVDPQKPKPVFFELNLGTPSGISNNFQLLDDLKNTDPTVYSAIAPYLPKDNTFSDLRQAVESNAEAWTGRKGLSVVISPGVYNGAHPDVVTVARESGMPLVKSSDLYQDADGWIRLRAAGDPVRDPIVTGIYGRMEESFFLQSNEHQIPLVSPRFEQTNKELSQKLNLDLRPGAIYQFIYDDQGEPVDVERDDNGRPKIVDVWDSIGSDPTRPQAGRGSFAEAILNRKLYLSNLGGRVVDDKRLFRIVSQYLIENPTARNVAHPVRGLSPDHLKKFFDNPNDFVVKEPANSGGVGIHFVGLLDPIQKERLIDRVRRDPTEFEIQYVSTIATLPQASEQNNWTETAIDLRLFTTMDARGEVKAGPNSVLLRTAPQGKLYSNTSLGGGYGILAVLKPKASFGWKRGSAPALSSRRWIPESTLQRTLHVLGRVKGLYTLMGRNLQAGRPQNPLENERAAILAYDLRDVMDVLQPWQTSLIPLLREVSELDPQQKPTGDMTGLRRQLHDRLGQFLQSVSKGSSPPFNIDMAVLRKFVKGNKSWLQNLDQQLNDPTREGRDPLNRLIQFRKLNPPEANAALDNGIFRNQQLEMAEYVHVDDPVVQKMIDEVKAGGGQVRLTLGQTVRRPDMQHENWYSISPYFWINTDPNSPSYLIPVIAIDLTKDRALAALAHEYQHFLVWKELYDRFRQEGLDHEQATLKAFHVSLEDQMKVYGEQRAVKAEIRAEKMYPDNPFNQSKAARRPSKFFEMGYVNRLTYPEYQGIRNILARHRWYGDQLDRAQLDKYLQDIIQFAARTKKKAIRYLDNQYKTASSPVEKDRIAKSLQDWRYSTLMRLTLDPYGYRPLESNQTMDDFIKYFKQNCQELGHTPQDCW